MSWQLDGTECEGFAAFVMRDGRDADGVTRDGLIVGWDEEARENVVAPFSELVGFEAACTCGWRGSMWRARNGEEWPEDIEIRPGMTAWDDLRGQWLTHALGED